MDEDVAALVVDNGSGMCKVSNITKQQIEQQHRTNEEGRLRKEKLFIYQPLISFFTFGRAPHGMTLEYSRLSHLPILIVSLNDGEKIDEQRSGPTSRTPSRTINLTVIYVF